MESGKIEHGALRREPPEILLAFFRLNASRLRAMKTVQSSPTQTLARMCLASLALLLLCAPLSRADPNTGVISEAEVVSFVNNTWGWSSFADNLIITKLDGAYDGLPYRDHIKAVIVGLELHQY